MDSKQILMSSLCFCCKVYFYLSICISDEECVVVQLVFFFLFPISRNLEEIYRAVGLPPSGVSVLAPCKPTETQGGFNHRPSALS